MCRPQDYPKAVQQYQEGIKQIKIKKIHSQSIGKIPQRKAPVPDVIDNGSVIHNILLPGVASDIVKNHQLISQKIVLEHNQTAECHQQKQKRRIFQIFSTPFSKSGGFIHRSFFLMCIIHICLHDLLQITGKGILPVRKTGKAMLCQLFLFQTAVGRSLCLCRILI